MIVIVKQINMLRLYDLGTFVFKIISKLYTKTWNNVRFLFAKHFVAVPTLKKKKYFTYKLANWILD